MTRRPLSLFQRLLVLSIPLEGLILVLFGIALIHHVRKRTMQAFRQSLSSEADAVAESVDFDAEGRPFVEADKIKDWKKQRLKVLIVNQSTGATWQFPEGWTKSLSTVTVGSQGREVHSIQKDSRGERLLVYTRTFDRADELDEESGADDSEPRYIKVTLAGSTAGVDDADEDFRQAVWVAGSVLMILTIFFQWIVIRYGLTPLERERIKLSAISGRKPDQRLDDANVPVEIRPFIREINALIDRLEFMIEKEKRFSADAAHELRTPITMVKSTLQSALMVSQERKTSSEAVSESLEDLGRLENVIESLLELSRWETAPESARGEMEEVDLKDILRDLTAEWRPVAREKNIEIIEHLEPCRIAGHRIALRRLFSNLIENALYYSEEGKTVTLTSGAEDGFPVASVKDSGKSIPKKERESIFERFYRGGAAHNKKAAGSGLGLSIAVAVAEFHRADLTLTSTGEEGNEFVVRFPRVKT